MAITSEYYYNIFICLLYNSPLRLGQPLLCVPCGVNLAVIDRRDTTVDALAMPGVHRPQTRHVADAVDDVDLANPLLGSVP